MINAVVVEDDIVYKTKLLLLLDEIGVTVLNTSSTIEATIETLTHTNPDILITDILLDDKKIFEIYKNNPAFYKIPTIFITSSKNEVDYKIAKKVNNSLYVVKPIHKLTLKSSIETLCGSLNKYEVNTNNVLFIRGRFNQKIELEFEKIIHIEQKHNYCKICTLNQEFVLKKSLVNVIKELDKRFLKVHRSHCINKDYIENFGVGLDKIKLKNVEIPIGLTFKESVKELIAQKFSVK